LIDFVYYEDWVPSTDGDGPSLQPADILIPVEHYSAASTWVASESPRGSPGSISYVEAQLHLTAALSSEGQLRLDFSGSPGSSWALLSTTNWKDWETESTLVIDENGTARTDRPLDPHGEPRYFKAYRDRDVAR
jgi:hypothetical protein